jgi:asparagine synthase (glutamine-hydrolysing)
MCGFVALHGNADDTLLKEMMDRMRHRGPDGGGTLQLGDSRLGHVRLAILDLPAGSQPMLNERRDLAVVFNGEVYNHLKLRRDLEQRHQFKTRSDTKVLLHLYEEEAEDMLPKLDGMFAFALAGPKGVMLARDPLGIKPLYYGRKGNTFIAASEIKAFPPMDELHSLPPGHAMYFGEAPFRFSLPFPPKSSLFDLPLPEVLKEIRRRFEQAVLKRLMSDVPVGVYLSGGLDSSLVAAVMRPHTVELHSFTAGIQGAPDLEVARGVADYLGTNHHEMIYTEDEVEQAIPEVVRSLESFDAPLVRSAVPMYFVSKLARKHVKVVLTGEGADELFAGYEYLKRYDDPGALRAELDNIILRLENTNLQRADRITMAHGIEARVPFLDLDLVRFAARLPVDLIRPREDRPEKWLLREACKGLLPNAIMQRKKMKFSEGAGSADVIAERLRQRVPKKEFADSHQQARELALRSPEELYYYQVWREAFGPHVDLRIVGRTSDTSAAAARARFRGHRPYMSTVPDRL